MKLEKECKNKWVYALRVRVNTDRNCPPKLKK